MKGKSKPMKHNMNNPIVSINDIIADILYNKIQARYKTLVNPLIRITDREVFRAAIESRKPWGVMLYDLELVTKSLNKIKGVTARYSCGNPEEPDGVITVVLD